MRLAFISDIHSDLPSLEKALTRIRKLICDKIICLGDIVGYSYHYSDVLDGRDPDACCELVRERCDVVIGGNHDLHALKKIPSNHRNLGLPRNWYELEMDERASLSANRFWLYDDELEHPLVTASEKYISGLPETSIVNAGEYNILCTHFIAPDILGVTKINPASPKEFSRHLRLVKKQKCRMGIAGHAHMEGYILVSRKHYRINDFSKVNLPGEPHVILGPAITRGEGRTGFMLLDTGRNEIEAIPLD